MTNVAEKALTEVIEFAGDIRWRELAEGAPFTTVDRQLLGEMRAKARSSGVLAALATPPAVPSEDQAWEVLRELHGIMPGQTYSAAQVVQAMLAVSPKPAQPAASDGGAKIAGHLRDAPSDWLEGASYATRSADMPNDARAELDRRATQPATPEPAGEGENIVDQARRLIVSKIEAAALSADTKYFDQLIEDVRHARPAKMDTWLAIDAVIAALQRASVQKGATFAMGDRVEKTKGSSWRGKVVGAYSTSLTREGYAVESENEPGSVQIYPVAALRRLEPRHD